MIITSFDNVHESLLDNAIILGALAILTGFVFVLDICCLRQRAHEDKVTKQEKEFRMQRNGMDGHKNGLVSEKVYVKSKAIDEVDKPQEKVISELRSSLKKKHEADDRPQETHFRVEQEQIQTKENLQYGRKYLDNRGFNQKPSKQAKHMVADEDNNGYDYDIQSIKNYENRGSIASVSSNDSSDDSEYNSNVVRYNRKSRGSQTKRKHFAIERKMKDAETATDSPKVIRPTANGVIPNGIIQSSKISTTDPHKSDSPTSEEGYKVQPPPSSSYLLANGKKYQPVITPSRIEKITKVTTESSTTELRSVPSSPQDPGYVLHTASKWPNASSSGPTPYQKWKDARTLRTVQSNV